MKNYLILPSLKPLLLLRALLHCRYKYFQTVPEYVLQPLNSLPSHTAGAHIVEGSNLRT